MTTASLQYSTHILEALIKTFFACVLDVLLN